VKTGIILLFILFLMVNMGLKAQTPEWQWAIDAGGTGADRGFNIYIDDSNNCYVTGYFEGTATFGSYSLTSSGNKDIYVAKADADGTWQWASRAGAANGIDMGRAIAMDGNGNIYVTGQFANTADFGSYSLTSNGMEDIFVAKLDQNGIWQWAVSAGGTGFDMGGDISIDDNENLYITGGCETATFGPYSITSAGGTDIYVAKLDNEGNWLWATGVVGSSAYEYSWGIVLDGTGNPYITGYFKETAVFGSYSITSSGSEDIFVAKIDQNGTWQWATKAGGSSWDFGYDIAIDEAANCYVTGKFSSTANFGTGSLTSSGSYDVFVAMIDANGVWQWAAGAGGTGMDCGYKITLDDAENSYLTGDFRETATFGSDTFSSSGENDIFVAKADANGIWQWAVQAGGVGWDLGFGIALDNEANCYLTGLFEDTSTFGSYSFTSSGEEDIFVAKLGSPVSSDPEIILDAFSLSNFPNPFNPETTIEFSIEQNQQNEQIELEIYNFKGQKIKTIPVILSGVEGSVIWNGTDNSDQPVSSGIYLYKLNVNGKTEAVKKCLLLK